MTQEKKSLRDLLENFFQKQNNWKITLLSKFHEIVGADLKDHVSIIKINETSIVIGVSNSCLLQELKTLTSILLANLNRSLDIPRLTSIQFKLQGLSQTQKTFLAFNDCNPLIHEAPSLTQHDQKALNKIKDKELAHVLESFRKRCYREAQWKKK